MKKAKENDWLRILEVIRTEICPRDSGKEFSAADVEKKAGVADGPSSDARTMASGYLSSFRKWGFIRRTGKLAQTGPGRPTYTYLVTDYGYNFECLESQRTLDERHMTRLLEAVQALRRAEGQKAEASALRALFKTNDDVSEERREYEVKKKALYDNLKKKKEQTLPLEDGLSHGVPQD